MLFFIAYKDGYETSDVLTATYNTSSSPEPTAVSIVPNEVTLRPGESVKLKVVLTPANATTTLTWIWLPYCSGAYEFDGKGIVTAIAGQYDSDNVIEVRTSNGLSAQAFIIVLNSTDVQLPTAYSNGDNPIYSVTGQRRLTLKKGLNIVGGKKILVK